MATPGFTVRRRGTDSSGRGIYATDFLWAVWQAILARPRVRPFAWKITVVQGGFMYLNGGGASASEGFHNQGGCWDVRTWNLTVTERNILFWEAALVGAMYFWYRDYPWYRGGMAPHGHAIAGWDRPLDSGAAGQWRSVLAGGNGLAVGGSDYERRPSPKPTYPSRDLWEDPMADYAELLNRLDDKVDRVLTKMENVRKAEAGRDERLRQQFARMAKTMGGAVDMLNEIDQTVDATARTALVKRMRDQIIDALTAAEDVDGADKPARRGAEEEAEPRTLVAKVTIEGEAADALLDGSPDE